MNSESETLPRSPASPAPSSPAAPEPPPSAAPAPNRRNGKIPHLSKEHRDLINHYFDDGLTYQAVSRKLAEQGISINGANLSAWYNGGYQDHLRQTERCALLADSQQRLLDLALKHDAPALASVGLQLAVTQLAQQLADLAPGSHKDAFQNDSTLYLRMLNTLARMSKALLSLEQYHDACAQAVAAELKQMNTDRELADNEFQLLVKRMDRVFKVARPSSAAPATSGNPVPAAPKPSGEGGPATEFKVGSSALDVQCSRSRPPSTFNPQPSTAEPIAVAAPQSPDEGESAPQFEAESSALEAQCSQPSTFNPQPSTTESLSVPSSSPPNSKLKTQNSKLEACPACKLLLPPLLKNGERALPVCPKCGSALPSPPSWTPFHLPSLNTDASACHLCRERHQLDPNGLPDPCPECGFHLLTHPAN